MFGGGGGMSVVAVGWWALIHPLLRNIHSGAARIARSSTSRRI